MKNKRTLPELESASRDLPLKMRDTSGTLFLSSRAVRCGIFLVQLWVKLSSTVIRNGAISCVDLWTKLPQTLDCRETEVSASMTLYSDTRLANRKNRLKQVLSN